MTAHDDELKTDALTAAIVGLNAPLDLRQVLERFVSAAQEHTGAKYAAINVLDEHGTSVNFIYAGMEAGVMERLRRAPNAVGVLAAIPSQGVLVLDDLTEHPAFGGLPPGHPKMGAFLGAALRVRDEVFGYLYLAEKEGGFTHEDQNVVLALAAASSVAVDNATMYERALSRERWLQASQEITTAALADPGNEDVLTQIVDAALSLADAAAVALVLPGFNNAWVMEITAGERADELLGLELPLGGHGLSVIASGEGSVASTPPPGQGYILEPVREFGPALYAPLLTEGKSVGLLMFWRDRSSEPFDRSDLDMAQRFANQAALVLGLAELRHSRDVASLMEERQSLAHDLHDLVSQELFATAMQLDTLRGRVPAEFSSTLEATLEHVTRAQQEVRQVMRGLAEERTSEPLVERLQREFVLAQSTLGFTPECVVETADIAEALSVDPTLADDIVAVVREGLSNVARHAQATSASVVVFADTERVSVLVRDDGIGPPHLLSRHSGTANMANRALRRAGNYDLRRADLSVSDRPGTIAEWNVRWRAVENS